LGGTCGSGGSTLGWHDAKWHDANWHDAKWHDANWHDAKSGAKKTGTLFVRHTEKDGKIAVVEFIR